jgi:hypothetical protein
MNVLQSTLADYKLHKREIWSYVAHGDGIEAKQ